MRKKLFLFTCILICSQISFSINAFSDDVPSLKEMREWKYSLRIIGSYGISKSKGENFDFSKYYPVTKNINNIKNILISLYRDDLKEYREIQPDLNFSKKPNFIIFPMDTNYPYIEQWDEKTGKYITKYSVTPGENYIVIFDNERLENRFFEPLDKDCNIVSEGRFYMMQYGWNNRMSSLFNIEALQAFKASNDTVFMKKSIHRVGEGEELEYIRLNFPMINVPAGVDGDSLKFIHIKFDSIGKNLEDRELGIVPVTGYRFDPPESYSAYCIPSDGNDMRTCLTLSKINVAAGSGRVKYFRK